MVIVLSKKILSHTFYVDFLYKFLCKVKSRTFTNFDFGLKTLKLLVLNLKLGKHIKNDHSISFNRYLFLMVKQIKGHF